MSENLFLQTRGLTQAREDHLTYFLAAAITSDETFRRAYGNLFLLKGAPAKIEIVRVETQATYGADRCRPDLRLHLQDGSVFLVEHKLEAPETNLLLESGETKKQLERYLALPVDGVLYFRITPTTLPPQIVKHPRYIKPVAGAHFLWSDIYAALEVGEHILTKWIFEAFRRLAFIPPLPHIGRLSPTDSETVVENQRNFAKLWRATRAYADMHWKVTTGSRCELYLKPCFSNSHVTQVYVSPLAQAGSLLRVRAHTSAAGIDVTAAALESAAARIPMEAEFHSGQLRNGTSHVDLLMPLSDVLATVSTPEAQEKRLFEVVTPLLDAVRMAAG